MAYIDPDGLFNGDRIAKLTDEAKLFWPFFWCASNTVGRLELNYRKVCNRAFGQFSKPPSEERFWSFVREYERAYLIFTYKSCGQAWGQWNVSERYLPRHKLAQDSRTPAPIGKDFEAWKDQYIIEKEKCVFAKSSDCNNSAHLEKSCVERSGSGSGSGSGENLPAERGKTAVEVSAVAVYASKIYSRHPKVRRDVGVRGVEKALEVIVRKVPAEERDALLSKIDRNHEGFCASEGWTKEGGQFAKGLTNWLAPTMDRFQADPPPPNLNGPQDKLHTQRTETLGLLTYFGSLNK